MPGPSSRATTRIAAAAAVVAHELEQHLAARARRS